MSYFIKAKAFFSAMIKNVGKSYLFLKLTIILVGVLIILIGGLFIFIPEQAGINGLNTIDDALSYAHHMPELPPMDNTNMVRPDYGLFHRANNASYVVRKWRAIATYFHLSSAFTWSPNYFKSLLELTVTRLKNYKIEKNIMYKITPTPQTRFVVFGDLSGAYHSLTRGLAKLYELGILDRSLKIATPETFIVFMGDAISRSPYGMETLGLLLRLMEMNPDKVIYMRGNHEDNKYWEAFGLKDQLDIRFGLENAPPIVSLINTVFMRLPLGLYIAIPQEKNHFLRISHLSSSESSKLKEDNYAHFLEAAQQSLIDRYEIDKSVTHNNKIAIEAVINSEKKRHTFQVSTGMRQLPPDGGAIAWTLLSAPTLVNQKGLKFVDDAFAVLQLAATKEDWKITLYAQNALKVDGFTETHFQFFTGAPYEQKKKIASATPAGATETPVSVPIAPPTPVIPATTTLTPTISTPATSAPVVPAPVNAIIPTPSESMPRCDVLPRLALKRAIKSYFIQRLITPHKRLKPEGPEQTAIEHAAPVAAKKEFSLGETTSGAMHGISLTIGTPVRNKETHALVIPLSVTVNEGSALEGEKNNELAEELPAPVAVSAANVVQNNSGNMTHAAEIFESNAGR